MSDPIITGGTILASDFVGTRYLAITPADCIPISEAELWDIDADKANSGDASACSFNIPIHLPHGAVISALTIFWYKNDATASGLATLSRRDRAASSDTISQAGASAATGYYSEAGSAPANNTVDNQNYGYNLLIDLTPNDAWDDIFFCGALITFTITTPKP